MFYPKKTVFELAITLLQGLLIHHPTAEQTKAAETFIRRVILPIEKDLIIQTGLTPKEWLCINLAASGFSIEETAKQLSLTHHTIKNYREQIRQKLHCKTITQAVYKVFTESEIPAEILK